jgi:hypothetical protein
MMETVIFEEGTSRFSLRAIMALRIIVKVSAIKSVLDIYNPLSLINCGYQLAFFTPGITPFHASSLKQIRHNWNLRKNPPERPQIAQRLYLRAENFLGLFHLFTHEVLAI